MSHMWTSLQTIRLLRTQRVNCRILLSFLPCKKLRRWLLSRVHENHIIPARVVLLQYTRVSEEDRQTTYYANSRKLHCNDRIKKETLLPWQTSRKMVQETGTKNGTGFWSVWHAIWCHIFLIPVSVTSSKHLLFCYQFWCQQWALIGHCSYFLFIFQL